MLGHCGDCVFSSFGCGRFSLLSKALHVCAYREHSVPSHRQRRRHRHCAFHHTQQQSVLWCACTPCRHGCVSSFFAQCQQKQHHDSQAAHFLELKTIRLHVRVLRVLPRCWGPGWLCRELGPRTSLDEGCRRSWGCGFLVRTKARRHRGLLSDANNFYV